MIKDIIITMNYDEIYGAKIINKGLKIKDNLIISDLHFGYETTLNKQGLMIPQIQYDKIINSLDKIQKNAKAKNIILNGDIKHNLGKIDKQEWREVLDFIDYLSDNFVDIHVIKGNHDNLIQYILNKRDITLEDYVLIDNFFITHGHKIPENIPDSIDTFIIGHEHPCIGIRNNERIEKVKSYLKGKWNKYNLIVTPSFTPISYGSDILHKKTISPFIENINDFEIYAIEKDEVYYFGLVEDILNINKEEFNNF